MTASLKHPIAIGVIAILLLILVASTFSIVPETKQAVIVRFGEAQRILNKYRPGERFGESGAGLAARMPFLEQVVWIDKRIQSVEMENQQVLSTDQLRLQVDAFARYRIVDPLRMYISARTEENVSNQLKPILGSALRNELGRRPFAALLSPERGQMMDNIQNALNRVARQYGAEIVDVRIKRADLPDGTPLEFRLRADAHGPPAGGGKHPRPRPETGADHPRRGRCRSRRHLCRRVQSGSGILRFLPGDAVLRGELRQHAGPGPAAARPEQHHPVAEQRLSAPVQGQSLGNPLGRSFNNG